MNKTSRLVFLSGSLALFCSDHSPAQDFDAVEIKVHPVAGQVYYVEGAGGNVGLFAGSDGVFVIDDQFAALTDRIVKAIRTVSDEPIRFLVNTHMHPDHTGGNENFGEMGTLIFGHDNVRRQMIASDYEQEPPLVTYSDELSFHINGETVHVFKAADAHTDGDSFIHFKGSNVIHAGDVYRTTTYPYIDTEHGGSYLGTKKALEQLIEIAGPETKIIPGHGVVSNEDEVRVVVDMMQVIQGRVEAAIRDGKSVDEARAAGLTAEYDERWNTETGRGTAAALIGAAYKDLRN
jgi:cyclase